MSRLLRILLFAVAAVFVWWAFIRRTPAVINGGINPVTGTRVGTGRDISATANAAAAQVVASAGNAAAQGAGQITGIITNGIAQTLQGAIAGNYGGSNSSATTNSQPWADSGFINSDSTAYPADDTSAIDTTL
jgi:hypothetical protein